MSRRNDQAGFDSDSDDSDNDSIASNDALYGEKPVRQPPPPQSRTTCYMLVGIIFLLLLVVGGLLGVLGSKGLLSFGSGSEADETSTDPATVTQKETVTAPATSGGGGGGGTSSAEAGGQTSGEGGGSRTAAATSDRDHTGSEPTKTANTSGSAPSSTGGSSTTVPSGATELSISFSSYTSSDSVDTFLEAQGLLISDYPVGSTPYAHDFVAANVDIVDGILQLKVLGGTKEGGSVSSSEVGTAVDNILFGQITTRAKSTSVPGVCHGFFYYLSDESEIDIEILTSYITEGLEDGIPPGLEFTNHGSTSTNKYVPYNFGDPAAAFHDYTVLWEEGSTQFFVDGELLATITENVPSKPGPWLFNSWSSGEPNWSAGPPTEDSVLQIESISGYYYTG